MTAFSVDSVFMVERDLSGISMAALAAAQRAAIARTEGTEVRYVRSTFAPSDGRCFCLFEGPSADAVQQVNDAAGLPHLRIVPAVDLRRPD